MRDLDQYGLEMLADELEGRAIWMQEVTFTSPSTNALILLVHYMEMAVGLDERRARHSFWDNSQEEDILFALDNFKRGLALYDYDINSSLRDRGDGSRFSFSVDAHAQAKIGLEDARFNVQKNFKPVIKMLIGMAKVSDPIFILPFVDHELNLHDHNRIISDLDRWVRDISEIRIFVSGQIDASFLGGSFRNPNIQYMTDGQYNALRSGRVRRMPKSAPKEYSPKYQEEPRFKRKRSDEVYRIDYYDPMTDHEGSIYNEDQDSAIEHFKSSGYYDGCEIRKTVLVRVREGRSDEVLEEIK